MKFTVTHAYEKDTETVFTVLTDTAYLMKKFEATGAKNIEIPVCTEENEAFVITRKMDIPAKPPGFAKKFIKAMNTVIATDTWQSYDGEKKSGVFKVDIKGLPVAIDGTLALTPTSRGCDFIIAFDVRVNIPLIGNKIAKIIENDTRSNQSLDYQFTATYLDNL